MYLNPRFIQEDAGNAARQAVFHPMTPLLVLTIVTLVTGGRLSRMLMRHRGRAPIVIVGGGRVM